MSVCLDYKHPDGETFHSYPPQQPFEFERLCHLVREIKPTVIFEIGSRHGRSLIRLAEAGMPSLKRVVTIDLPGVIWGLPDSEKSLNMCADELRGRGIEVEVHLIDSHGEEAAKVVERYKGKIDFAFIDGDHSYDGVKKDWELISPAVKIGGVIAFHDICPFRDHRRHFSEDVDVDIFWAELTSSLPKECSASWIKRNWGMGIGVVVKK